MNVLPTWPLLSVFLAASFILAITPGPGVFYIVARSVAQGRRHGLASVAGVALGNLGNAVGASLGLAALFAVSSTAFTLVKYAGALYLVYLGIQVLRAPGAAAPLPAATAPHVTTTSLAASPASPVSHCRSAPEPRLSSVAAVTA